LKRARPHRAGDGPIPREISLSRLNHALATADNPGVSAHNPLPSRQLRVKTGPGATSRLRRGLRALLVLDVRRPEARALALLAVEEIVVNIAEHGYGGEAGHPISVIVRPREEEVFEIAVRDRAPVVDVTALPPVDLGRLARDRAVRGRGLTMVRLLTRSMVHRSRRRGGNELILTFDAVELSRRVEEDLGDAA
jgi:anti-sigma regulatory factor (Ser/Thr protein kinase)